MQCLIDATKECRVCKEVKPITDFHPNKQCKQGVVGTCRTCSRVRIADWYKSKRKERQDDANLRNRTKKQMAVDLFGGVCFDCKQSYPNCVFQFHHLDPGSKDFNPSYAMANGLTKMWKELAKCVMLCANCHIIRHDNARKEGVNGSSTH